MSNQKVVGLIGLKGAGKDTCAAFLVQERGYIRAAFADALYNEVSEAYGVSVEFLQNRDTKELPQAELALSRCGDERFKLVGLQVAADEQDARDALNADGAPAGDDSDAGLGLWIKAELAAPRSPRRVLQIWGTEYRRKLDDDSYWLNQVKDLIKSKPDCDFVLTDVRFSNEATFVGEIAGGVLARVRRPALEAQAEADRQANGTAAHPSETQLLEWPTAHTFINEEEQQERLREDVLKAL